MAELVVLWGKGGKEEAQEGGWGEGGIEGGREGGEREGEREGSVCDHSH